MQAFHHKFTTFGLFHCRDWHSSPSWNGSAWEQGDQQQGEHRQAEHMKKEEHDFSLKPIRKLGKSATECEKIGDYFEFLINLKMKRMFTTTARKLKNYQSF